MYHIPNDLRARKTAFKIYQSLRHNLWDKELKDITVMDIYKESKIARTTFYRLFDNVIDVLEYQLDIYFKEYNELKKDKTDRVLFFYEYFDKHSDLIYIISTQNEGILKRVMENNLINTQEYYVALKIGIMTSLLCTWTKNKKKETPLEMSTITKKLLSNNVINILTEF